MAYFQQSIVTPTLVESGIEEALVETIRATRALNKLLYIYHVNGDGSTSAGEDFAEGAQHLIETQCLVYAGIKNAIEAQEDAREAEALAAAEVSKVTDVRREFILAQAKSGVAPKVIAGALNMKLAYVARVLAAAAA